MASLADMIQKSPGILRIVGTPIGNLQDLSDRVRDALCSCDLLLCEDTRVTAKLMHVCHSTCSLERCDQNVIEHKIPEILERLKLGQQISFVSDAGMPGISDPGQALVDACLEAGYKVEVIPGPSAAICAMVASGFDGSHFFFEGFLPRKTNDKVRRLEMLRSVPGALIFYESPHRILATLQAFEEVYPHRRVALVRELTKIHEEVIRGDIHEVVEKLQLRTTIKGECVLVVEAPSEQEIHQQTQDAQMKRMTLDEAIEQGLLQGSPKSALARQLARTFACDRGEIYDRITTIARKKSQ